MIIPFQHFVAFSALLFATGVYGVLTRRNIIGILISIELIVNAANLNLVVFSRAHSFSPEAGQIFALFVIALAAIAASVGLALVLALYRVRKTVFTDEIELLKW